jgi:transposase
MFHSAKHFMRMYALLEGKNSGEKYAEIFRFSLGARLSDRLYTEWFKKEPTHVPHKLVFARFCWCVLARVQIKLSSKQRNNILVFFFKLFNVHRLFTSKTSLCTRGGVLLYNTL